MEEKKIFNEEKRENIKFSIGAILLLVASILSIVTQLTYITDEAKLPVTFWLVQIAMIAAAVMMILKKRGPILIAPFAVWGVICLIGINTFDIINFLVILLSIIPVVCCCLLIASTIGADVLKKYTNVIKIALIASAIVYIVFTIYQGIFSNAHFSIGLNYLNYLGDIIIYISLMLIGDWIINPYVSKKQTKEADGDVAIDSEYYVSMGKHVCLLIFTFGIWALIWTHRATKFTNIAKGEEEREPIKKLLLCIFVPFYVIYWTYVTAVRLDKIAKDRGISSDLGTVCLILAIFVGFVPPILMQSKINQIIETPLECGSNNDKYKNGEMETAESLEKYKELLDKGVITQEEFDLKKKQLLGL